MVRIHPPHDSWPLCSGRSSADPFHAGQTLPAPALEPVPRAGWARRRSAPEGWSDRRMVDRYVRPLLLEIERGHWHDAPVWLGPRASGPTPRTIAVPRHQRVAGPTITAEQRGSLLAWCLTTRRSGCVAAR